MTIVTVSEKGQVVIPANIRKLLGITPGCQLDFSLEGHTMRAEVKRQLTPSTIEEGFGMLLSKAEGKRKLSDFDVAGAMRRANHDRS
jgi:AbrB family looped-hinge helix DNA binding protein